MSYVPQSNLYEYSALPISGQSVDISRVSQRARYLYSLGATEENNLEFAQLIQQLIFMRESIQQTSFSEVLPQTIVASQQETHDRRVHTLFTPAQADALKYQMIAFQLLQNHIPIPPGLQQLVLVPISTVSTQSSREKLLAQQNRTRLILPAQDNLTPIQQPDCYSAYINPRHLLPKNVTYYENATRHHKLVLPSLTSIGLDPQEIIACREQKIASEIQLEMNSLKCDNIKDLIRLKSLKLLEKQQTLRNELVQGVAQSTVLVTEMDKKAYRRFKKITLKTSRQVALAEMRQRKELERQKDASKQSHLYRLMKHGSKLISFHTRLKRTHTKLGKHVMAFHQRLKKRHERNTDKSTRARIRSLKNNDKEAYNKLIDQEKKMRLKELLRQTDQYLEMLTESIAESQSENKKTGSNLEEPVSEPSSSSKESSSAVYHSVTHRIQETVRQPSMMTGGTLKDYQLKGLQWMVSLYNNNLNGILADEMGLGKTIQIIGLIAYLIECKKQDGPFLIVTPLSTLTNWKFEFEKWVPSVPIITYSGRRTVREELAEKVLSGKFQVLITTFEYIVRDHSLLSGIKWLYIIIDEGHRMKNFNSKLSVALRTSYKSCYKLITTGTPLQNNLPELWSLLNFILPTVFKSIESFEEWFNSPFANQGLQDKVGLDEGEQLIVIQRLHKVLRPFFLRRLKKDVESELPEKVEHIIKCTSSALQLELYQQLIKNNSLYVHDGIQKEGSHKSFTNIVIQLRKVCNHPFLFENVASAFSNQDANALLYRTSGKFELLDKMVPKLKHTGHRVLIFFQMTRVMDIMESYLNWRHYSYLRLDGATKSEERSPLLNEFNLPASPYFIFLLSTRAGGVGLNLQSADTVILFDSDWNPHQDIQAQARAHRIGQTKKVHIYRLITRNSIEEAILERANFKLDIEGKVIHAGGFDNSTTEKDREALLKTLLEGKLREINKELHNETDDDEELNQILQRSPEDLAIFRKLDNERDDKEPRLIQQHELPDMFAREKSDLNTANLLLEFGRGCRVREKISYYSDGMAEKQWLRDFEKPEQEDEKTKVMESKKSNKRISQDEHEEQAKNTKRSRNSKDALDPELRGKLTQVFEACYKTIKNAIVEEKKEDESHQRRLCKLFMYLVKKKEFPSYYASIKNPISMVMIIKRIHSNFYDTLLEFQQDFQLLFDNARFFNRKESTIHKDADALQKIFELELKKQCADDDLLQDLYGQLPVMTKTDTNHIPSTAAKARKKPKSYDRYRELYTEEEDEHTEEEDEIEINYGESDENYCE